MSSRWGKQEEQRKEQGRGTEQKSRYAELEDLPPLPAGFDDHFMQAVQRVKEVAAAIKEQRSRFTLAQFGNTSLEESDGSGRQRVTEILMVPGHRAGLVIGHHGETLKRIEKMSQCKVQFDQSALNHQNNANQAKGDRRVIITGYPEDVEEAKKLVLEKVEDPSSRFPSIQLAVPHARVGLVIGRGGETIRELQERSGAKVTVQQDNASNPMSSDRIVTIIGDDESIGRAKQLIEDLVSGRAVAGSLSVPNLSTSSLSTARNANQMQIPESSVGAVIGKRAETLRSIQTMSGCRVTIEHSGVPSSYGTGEMVRNVHLTGAPDQIAYAQQLIAERVAANEAANQYYHAASSGNYYEQAAMQQPSVIYQNPLELGQSLDPTMMAAMLMQQHDPYNYYQ